MLILAFAFWAGMAAHFSYRYPLHVDEWIAVGYAQSMMEEGSLQHPNPFTGSGVVSFNPEMGLHMLLGALKSVTGVSWLGLYRVAPELLMALLAFLTYAVGRRDGYGWAAALLVPLIPTSVRTLGPTLLVPVSVAVLFIPVTLLVLHRLEARNMGPSLWLLLLIIGGTIFVHPTTEGAVTGLAVLYLLALLLETIAARRYRTAAGLVVAVAVRMLIPALILGIWLPSLGKSVAQEAVAGSAPIALAKLGFNHGFFEAFGIVPVALFVAGAFLFATYSRYGLRSYILPVFTGLLLFFLLYLHPRYFLGPSALYDRGWVYLGFLMSLLAGYAVATYFRCIPGISERLGSLASLRYPRLLRFSLMGLGVVVVAVTITGSMTSRERVDYAQYYHLIGDQIEADFVWLGQHAAQDQQVALMEPSLAWAYPVVAEHGKRSASAASAPFRSSWTDEVGRLLATGKVDRRWLRLQGASVVYTRMPGSQALRKLDSADVILVRPGVYLFSPP